MPSEKSITASIVAFLRTRGACVEKRHGSYYGGSGQPDINACLDGRSIQLEVKQSKKYPTKLQKQRLKEWERSGALVGVVRSVEDVRRLLDGNL